MSAIDQCHLHIVRALQKDGWVVDQRPVRFQVQRRSIYIDIEAKKNENGSRQQILLAEVKCFVNRESHTSDLYGAIGQYIIYRTMLSYLKQPISLYLAVPEDAFDTIFDIIARMALQTHAVRLVVVNLEQERIVRWIE